MDPITGAAAASTGVSPWTIMAAMAGAGLAKSLMVDKPRAKRQRQQVAETQRYSPWTGQWADQSQIQEPNYFGDALSWGVTGGMLGQNYNTMLAQQNLMNSQAGYLDKMANPQTPPEGFGNFNRLQMPNSNAWSLMR